MQPIFTIRIALAEDNADVRSAFVHKARQLSSCQVYFAVKTGADCLDILGGLSPLRLPQLLFIDLEMPGSEGIRTISLARQRYPQIVILGLTSSEDSQHVFEAIQAGASGYVLKNAEVSSIQAAISAVLESGGTPMSAAIARQILQCLQGQAILPPSNSAQTPQNGELNKQELEMLSHIASGWDVDRIAEAIGISEAAVRKHVAHCYRKLHLRSRAQAISLVQEGNISQSA